MNTKSVDILCNKDTIKAKRNKRRALTVNPSSSIHKDDQSEDEIDEAYEIDLGLKRGDTNSQLIPVDNQKKKEGDPVAVSPIKVTGSDKPTALQVLSKYMQNVNKRGFLVIDKSNERKSS